MTLVEDALKTQGIPSGQAVATKNDPPLAPIGPYNHGVNGLFNRRDRDNPVFSAMMTPNMGVADAIPVFNGARFLDNQFGGTDAAFDSLITGMTAGDLDDFANQPTAPCEDGPTGGLLKFCSLVNTYGNYKMSTREVEIDRAGRVADMVDAQMVQVANQFPPGLFATPTETPSLQNAVNNELAMRVWEMIMSFQRMFAPRVFTGSPTNNNGEARDIVGLDIHINSGNKVDATYQTVCTAANSDVKNFNNGVVGSSAAGNIMQYLEMADAFVNHKARRQGLGTPEYIVGMRPELWQEITEIIPAQKYERVIAVVNRVTNGRAMMDARGVYDERNAIRASMLIPVNGRFLRVVVDDTIAETSLGNIAGVPTYASTIYGIPLTVLGAYPVTFWEYFNHGNAQELAIQARAAGLTWVTDGGMFRWFSDFSKGCLKLNAKFTPRLRMRTPQIAWRINNVGYAPLQHFSSWDPSSSYFVDGGVTTGDAGPLYYSAWSSDTPTTPGF
jgi:hypothetical protein